MSKLIENKSKIANMIAKDLMSKMPDYLKGDLECLYYLLVWDDESLELNSQNFQFWLDIIDLGGK